jgi:hypothetical protein
MTPEQRAYLDDVVEQLDRDYQGGLDARTKRALIHFFATIFLNGTDPIPTEAVEAYLRDIRLL